MKEIIAYEMSLKTEVERSNEALCVPFEKAYWEYMQKYNMCYSEMRKDLEIEPIYFYSDYSQMEDKACNTYICLKNGVITGDVSCYGNEVNNLEAVPIAAARILTENFPSELRQKSLKSVRIPALFFLARQKIFSPICTRRLLVQLLIR